MLLQPRPVGAVLSAAAAFVMLTGMARATSPSLPPPSSLVIGAPMEITVEGVKSARGHIHVDVCAKSTFLNDQDCGWSITAPAVAGATVVTLPRLPAGRYAVQAYQDENDNGKVDRNSLGIPKESVGFSRDPTLLLGPPHWRNVAIDQTASGSQIRLKLKSFP